ncbi:hypothetical protein [uncultured Arthrobacter sp.]|uniref:hypothetical protein n=1 Tax=uncultured Arthrobacter sp. TaxID=114050 RepID=UPI0028D6C2BD|nr:hypothetical protein [uncultured Arthrobacter sp.]
MEPGAAAADVAAPEVLLAGLACPWLSDGVHAVTSIRTEVTTQKLIARKHDDMTIPDFHVLWFHSK